MKKLLLLLLLSFVIKTQAQNGVVTCLPCNQLGMSINVGSSANSISIYHSGQYLTHPQSENIFIWEFTNQQGNILHQDTIVNNSFCNFSHSWSLIDTMNVIVHFVNDSAILPTGNSIDCLFEDQIYWDSSPNTPWGSWTFIHNNTGISQNSPLVTISPCDSLDIVTDPNGNLSMEFMLGWNLFTPIYIVSTDSNGYVLGEDSLTWTHYAYPVMAPGTSEFTTCINYFDRIDTLNCCVDFYFNGSFWMNSLNFNPLNISMLKNKKKLIKVVDILGREFFHNLKTPLFLIYDDGTVEKKIYIK